MSVPPSNASTVPTSMFPGGPPFQAWKLSELPRQWRQSLNHPDTLYIAVELPDMPWGHAYNAWFSSFHSVADFDTYAAVCVMNMQDYNYGQDQRERAGNVLRHLLETGKPPPDFLRILKREKPARADHQEMTVLPATAHGTAANPVINRDTH
jgi:hypothetical protein